MKTIDLDKWSRLARYQEKLPDNMVRCHVCPHNCIVHEGEYGFCQTRVNYQGELYCIAYGNPCSISVDPIEKSRYFTSFRERKFIRWVQPGVTFAASIARIGRSRNHHCKSWIITI